MTDPVLTTTALLSVFKEGDIYTRKDLSKMLDRPESEISLLLTRLCKAKELSRRYSGASMTYMLPATYRSLK